MAYFKPRPTREVMSSPDVRAAIAIQNEFRSKIILRDDFPPFHTLAGVDVGYDLQRNLTKAVIAVFDWPALTLKTSVIAYAQTDFPYIPGLLSFREIPAILKALDCLTEKPGLWMVDGQGIAHPRRMGIASYLGFETGIPAIGVAKSRLCGKHEEPGKDLFSTAPLVDKGEMIGTVLRSKQKCNPLFVSAGHKISQETALDITLQCFRGYRLSEPTRIADSISKWKLEKTTYDQEPADLFAKKSV